MGYDCRLLTERQYSYGTLFGVKSALEIHKEFIKGQIGILLRQLF